ncbi:hypothetical protein ACWD4O_46190 [Streptomyces sp. NPDC002623]
MTSLDSLGAVGKGEHGAVRLADAHLTGQLSMSHAYLHNSDGPAFQADASVFLDHMTANGNCEFGAVRIMHAHISQQLNLAEAVLKNDRGPALAGDGLRVGGSIVIGNLKATGTGEHGAVRFLDAHFSGRLSTRGTKRIEASLTNTGGGPALRAERLRVDSDVVLDGLTATGHSELATLHMPGSQIAGDLTVDGSVTNENGNGSFSTCVTLECTVSCPFSTTHSGQNPSASRRMRGHSCS